MAQYIDKSALVAEIERRETNIKEYCFREGHDTRFDVVPEQLSQILSFIDTLEVKEVDLIIHTIIAECCDWLAKNTNLSHDKIEGCRNLMLTVKEEQFKTQKGK